MGFNLETLPKQFLLFHRFKETFLYKNEGAETIVFTDELRCLLHKKIVGETKNLNNSKSSVITVSEKVKTWAK